MEDATAARRAHNLLQQSAFDEVAGGFGQPVPEDILERLNAVVERAQIRPDESVLDVGTGAGVLLPFILERQPARVVACDLSGEMVKLARQRFGESVTVLQSDVVDIPSEVGPFGAVFCNAMFGNVYDQRQTIEVIERLLDPGGRLVISHPLGSDFVRRLKAGSPQYHLKELPDRSFLNQLVEGAGLAVTHFVDETDLYLAICTKTDG
jgi:2-polyprenyl-3-methyl-5-hydroxy-6-metoxy-1,4-benzoquinol methylase